MGLAACTPREKEKYTAGIELEKLHAIEGILE